LRSTLIDIEVTELVFPSGRACAALVLDSQIHALTIHTHILAVDAVVDVMAVDHTVHIATKATVAQAFVRTLRVGAGGIAMAVVGGQLALIDVVVTFFVGPTRVASA